MLKALGCQLKMMSADPKDPFTSIIRGLVGPREAVHYEGPLRRMILTMPEMISQISAWCGESRQPLAVQRLHNFVLITLCNFKPDQNKGFLGYMQDAYLVAGTVHRTLTSKVRPRLRPHVNSATLLKQVTEWIEITKRLFPNETARLDRMLDELDGKHRGQIPHGNGFPSRRKIRWRRD